MSERFDVVVVGARCAGAPLATMLTRRGLKVVVVERAATFEHDPKPTQAVQSDVFAFLRRLGVAERFAQASGPFMNHVNGRFDDVRLVAPFPLRPDDPGGAAFIRRHRLDPILLDHALENGVDVRMETKVTGLLEEKGRVAGVRTARDGTEAELRAPLVVGADGRTSAVARVVGARKYNISWNERGYYWGYFEGADMSGPPTFIVHRWEDRFYWAGPADGGLYMVGISFDLARLAEFRRDVTGSFLEHMRSCEPLADVLADARLVGKPPCVIRFEGYFREASGAGWVLVGDAGHFKDPVAGRGVGDAFMQVDSLAPRIVAGLGSRGTSLDRIMKAWGRQRDRTFGEHYWLACDLSDEHPLPRLVPGMIGRLLSTGKQAPFLELLSHRIQPSQVMTPLVMLGAGRDLLKDGTGVRRRDVIGEILQLGRQDLHRRWVTRRPDFTVPPSAPAAARAPAAEVSTG